MHKLTACPSKAKSRGLARSVMALMCVFLPMFQALGADILIHSGEGTDTVMQTGPGVGGEDTGMRIESDPDNGTLMQVVPAPPERVEPDPIPVIVAPEIRVRRK